MPHLTFISHFLYIIVVNQRYEPEVQNPGGFIGANVLMKCNIPSFVKDYVTVTSWLQEPSFNIYPSMESGELKFFFFFLKKSFYFVSAKSTHIHEFHMPNSLYILVPHQTHVN